MENIGNEKEAQAKLERKEYLKEYQKNRKEKLGLRKISLVLTENEYEKIYKQAKESNLYKKDSKRKEISLAPYIKAVLIETPDLVFNNFEKAKDDAEIEALKESLRLIKNCSNNINQIAYALNMERFYQQNETPKTKEEELAILKNVYANIAKIEKIISNAYYEKYSK